MVDLKEIEMFKGDIMIAKQKKYADSNECERIINEQQRYIRSLVEENEKLREHILDRIIH